MPIGFGIESDCYLISLCWLITVSKHFLRNYLCLPLLVCSQSAIPSIFSSIPCRIHRGSFPWISRYPGFPHSVFHQLFLFILQRYRADVHSRQSDALCSQGIYFFVNLFYQNIHDPSFFFVFNIGQPCLSTNRKALPFGHCSTLQEYSSPRRETTKSTPRLESYSTSVRGTHLSCRLFWP